jgi:hypothetical protein
MRRAGYRALGAVGRILTSGATEMRIAVVTPYFKEGRDVLQRCTDSVRAQSVPVDHIFVADGHPQNWIESYRHVTHIVLRHNTGDFGDTPRSLGFVMGMRSEYDILQFLDVDNVLMPDHFDVVLGHFRGLDSSEFPDLVVARRHMLRPDGSILSINVPEDDNARHIDTSCYVFYRTAFDVGLKWSFIPKQLAFMDDRVFFAMLVIANLKIVFNQSKTVGYACLWEAAYRKAGEVPPPNCRNVEDHRAAALAWWQALDPHGKKVIERRLGVPIFEAPQNAAAAS